LALQQQNRLAQYAYQQDYAIRLQRDQQSGVQDMRDYNYGDDPYFYTASNYQYLRGGRYYRTNEYGANVLRRAVNAGYSEGVLVGRADRQDRWAYNYRTSYVYRDGTYGYRGFYVERAEYNYYFREGFRRGYEDGYYGRALYGAYATGRFSILGGILTTILDLNEIR